MSDVLAVSMHIHRPASSQARARPQGALTESLGDEIQNVRDTVPQQLVFITFTRKPSGVRTRPDIGKPALATRSWTTSCNTMVSGTEVAGMHIGI